MNMYLPNAENAFIANEKILDYLLDDENSKGKSGFFNRYGYFKDNFEMLIQDLKSIAHHGHITKREETKFGIKFVVDMEIISANNRTATISSVWMIDNESDFPRFITAYPL
jgi:hypothetical protein